MTIFIWLISNLQYAGVCKSVDITRLTLTSYKRTIEWVCYLVTMVTYRRSRTFFCSFFASTLWAFCPNTDYYRRIFDNCDICPCILKVNTSPKDITVELNDLSGLWASVGAYSRGLKMWMWSMKAHLSTSLLKACENLYQACVPKVKKCCLFRPKHQNFVSYSRLKFSESIYFGRQFPVRTK